MMRELQVVEIIPRKGLPIPTIPVAFSLSLAREFETAVQRAGHKTQVTTYIPKPIYDDLQLRLALAQASLSDAHHEIRKLELSNDALHRQVETAKGAPPCENDS